MTTLRQFLQQGTARVHQQLDSRPELKRLLRPGLGMDAYLESLQALGHAFGQTEEVLAEQPPMPELPPYQPRAAAINRDLQVLDGQIPGAGARTGLLPPTRTTGTGLGIRYVLDGSSQGSGFIYPKLCRHLPELGAPECSHYWQVQQTAGRYWPELCALLNQPHPDNLCEQALEGALWTFTVFERAFR
jgi:heme oxygenase